MRSLYVAIFLALCFNANGQIDSLQLAYDYFTLQNGVEVILQPDKNTNEVSVEFWVKNGTSMDRPEQYGLQHFFEHVMPYNKMDSINEKKFFDSYLKGSNAQVKKDFSRFYLKVIPEGVELALERALGRLTAGAHHITEKSVEYQRKRVLAEIEKNAKNPHWSAEGSLAIYEGTFGKGHPYAANGYGTIENNKAFSLNDFRQRYTNIIYSENIVLFVVGNFDEEKVKALIQQNFSTIGSKQQSMTVSKPVAPSSKRVSMKAPHPKDSLSTMVYSWAIPKWELKDDAVLKLVATHLNETFKTKNHFPSSTVKSGAYANMYKSAGQFHIRIQFSKAKDSVQIDKLILEKINELTTKGMTQSDLKLAKKMEIQNIKEMQEKLGFQSSRTELLGKSLLFKGNPNAYFERLKIQQELTAKQVREISKKWLKEKPFSILFVSNKT